MKRNTILLCILIALIGLPIAYYFGIAKPSLEREKFEYQKKINQEEKDKKALEEYERQEKYENCIRYADLEYENNLESVCNLSYDFCIESVKNWNSTVGKYNGYKDNSECDVHKYVNGGCTFYVQFNESRESKHKEALQRCDIQYK